jgi:hypothetical protein
MSDDAPITSFEEFWPFYVREHADATNRKLHFVGTSLALGALATSLLTRRARVALLAPLFGYGAAWIGHFVFEKNRPATFKHPLWSLKGDFIMYAKTLAGTMDAEVERCAHRSPTPTEPPRPSSTPSSTPPVNVPIKQGPTVLH